MDARSTEDICNAIVAADMGRKIADHDSHTAPCEGCPLCGLACMEAGQEFDHGTEGVPPAREFRFAVSMN